jgi:Spy/CpxP family protein refolding chaperone
MAIFKSTLPALVVAGALTATVLGLGGAALASADPPPPPGQGEQPPTWAPPQPAPVWDGQPVVWTSGWGGRWGVWINGMFITLTSNPVTNGG